MKHQQSAEVLFLHVTAVIDASAHEFINQEPSLRWVLRRPEVWNHVLKIASFAVASSNEDNDPALLDELSEILSRWNPRALQAIEDLFSFLGSGHTGDELPAKIGMWVLWNVKGTSDPPTLEESLGALKVGHFCIRVAGTWDLGPFSGALKSEAVRTGSSPQQCGVMAEFLASAGTRPYRELIEVQVRRLNSRRLMAACGGEVQRLPQEVRPGIELYIDQLNSRFCYSQEFWRNSDCSAAFYAIMDVAIQVFPIKERIPHARYALNDENQELAFSLFQVATISFAYSASSQRAQRKFMGIRKGLFG